MNSFVALYLIFLLGVEASFASARPQQYATTQYQNTLTDTADRLYVIESNLFKFLGLFGKLSHTGLLVKSKGKDIYTIIEYMGDGKVHTRPIHLSNSEITIFQEGENKWKKEQYGVVVNNLTIGQIKSTMENLAGQRKYDVTDHNCHIVQEATRYFLNLVGTYKIRYPKDANELIPYGVRMRIRREF